MKNESESPDFIKMLESAKSCKEGDVVSFDCKVSGWPEPEVLWLKDGQPVQLSHYVLIQDGGTLQIRDAQPGDTGTYTVRISNVYGVNEAHCRLEVQPDPDIVRVSPEFKAVLEDADCNEGDVVKFKAILTGDPNPEVIWYINGVPLTQSEKIQFISEDGICILTVKDVNRHHDGTVTCQGKNRLGSSSCEARLRVRVPPVPPYFERPLEDRMITENGAVMFELDVIGYPEPKVEFFLKGRPLIDGVGGVEIRQLESNYRLTISDCKIDAHDGELLCRAQNVHGQAESRARLTVEPEEEESRSAPTFIKEINDQTVKHGEQVIFEAIARGSPLPMISWFVNQIKLDAQTQGVVSIESIEMGTGQKVILDSTHFAGVVVCRAENSIGRSEIKARLIVLPKLKDAGLTKRIAVNPEGESCSSVEVIDGPPPKISRFDDAQTLKREGKTIFVTINDIFKEIEDGKAPNKVTAAMLSSNFDCVYQQFKNCITKCLVSKKDDLTKKLNEKKWSTRSIDPVVLSNELVKSVFEEKCKILKELFAFTYTKFLEIEDVTELYVSVLFIDGIKHSLMEVIHHYLNPEIP